MKTKEIIIIVILTILIAFMDITGIPSAFFINISVLDIDPMYFTLMVNFVLIGILAYFVLKYLCPDWKLGLTKEGLAEGLKKYGIVGSIVAIMGFVAFYIGLKPFDYKPSFPKVLIEGVIYYIGVAIVEELYVRGLLLNLIERFFKKNANSTNIAIIFSSVIFGLGHVFGVLNQPFLVIISKVIWTICMGMFFGVIYKKTSNLWLPIIIHFLINVCAIPYCFSSLKGYADMTLYIIVPVYLVLGIYCVFEMKKDIEKIN